MNALPSSFSSVIPSWMTEAYGRPSADEAMRWLMSAICQQLGAEACVVLRVNGTGTHGAVAWSHGAAVQTLSRDLYPLGGSTLERTLTAADPWALDTAMVPADPWLSNRGIQGGAMVALQQGPVNFGSLGVYYTRDGVDLADAISLLAEMRLVMWPLLCWQLLGGRGGFAAGDTPTSAIHRANNILTNIVLLTDLALGMPCGQEDEHMRLLLQRIATEGVRCADVLRELDAD